MKTAVCLIVKNEVEHILEWISYHYIIGFDSFIIYDNGSTDGTREEIDRCRQIFNIKLIDWPRISKRSQCEAYDDCLRSFRFDFDWIAFIDSDEFITPNLGSNIKNLLENLHNSSAVVLNWAIFGSSGQREMQTDLVTTSFLNRAPRQFVANRHVKTIVRPLMVKRVETCHDILVEGRTCFADGSEYIRFGIGTSSKVEAFDICRINHYFVRSRSHWAKKISRGYTDISSRTWAEFDVYDRNEVYDPSMVGYELSIRSAIEMIQDLPYSDIKIINETILSLPKDDPRWIAAHANPLQDIRLLIADKASSFDARWYRSHYCIFDGRSDQVLEEEFYQKWMAKGRKPNKFFDPAWYLDVYADVRSSNMPAFEHYKRFGSLEGRRPSLFPEATRKLPVRIGGKT